MSLFKLFIKKPKREQGSLKKISPISFGINKIFSQRKLDKSTLEELEDLLLTCDIGYEVVNEIITILSSEKFSKEVSDQEIKIFIANYFENILKPCEKKLELNLDENIKSPKVIIFNGVNGSGKTTTIGKIARQLTDKNKKVVIAACDTFRAAAAEQLKAWADLSKCKVIEKDKEDQDPASVAYKAFKLAKEEEADVLLIDTAGRLQNKQNLMQELAKINKVLKKLDQNESIFENILVLDATTGQNAISQMKSFDEITNITAIIMTKLDGSAKGGILIPISKKFQKPIYALGSGEKVEDLQEFSASNFSKSLLGI